MDSQRKTLQGATGLNENPENNNDAKTCQNKLVISDTSMNWQKCGNKYFVSKRHEDAIAAYTNGIEAGDNSIDLISNRSAAYLAIFKYKLALDDAEFVLKINENHIKCIFRKVKALFGMKLYKDAMVFLETISVELMPRKDGEIIADLKKKGKSFMTQSENGEYPWMDLYEAKTIYHDLAEYTSSVIMKKVPIKGRGLFATKTINAGELILASKAFAYLQDNVPMPSSNSLSPSTQTEILIAEINRRLLQKIAQVLEKDPEKCRQLYSLYAGPKLDYLKYDEEPTSDDYRVNEERIESVFVHNGISSYKDVDGSTMIDSGIWIISSFLNHSCVDANSTWLNIGDFVFIRAFRKIFEGDEIVICYKSPKGLIAQNELNIYGFRCTCRLCKRDALDNETVRAERFALLSQLETITGKFKDPSTLRMQKKDEVEILRLLKLFEQSRQDAPELNCCLTDELFVFGIFRFENMDFMKAANTFENLYNMIEKVPAFYLVTVEVCLHIALAYLTTRKTAKGEYWLRILKKKARLAYGTEKVLDVKHSIHMELIRSYGVDL